MDIKRELEDPTCRTGHADEVMSRAAQVIRELEAKLAERYKLIAEDRENRELMSKVAEQIREDIKSGKRPKIDLSVTPENKDEQPPTG